MLSTQQAVFFDKTVKIKEVKECMSSPEEYAFMDWLVSLGFSPGSDFTHQFACCQEEMGLIAVADFGFPNQKIIIELDGKNHEKKKQKKKDEIRDGVFMRNGFMVFRIKTPLCGEDMQIYKHLLRGVYKDRDKLYQEGKKLGGGRVYKTHIETYDS